MFALAIAAALYLEAAIAAWVLEGVLVGGVLSVVIARFCVGAYTYHLLRQQISNCRAGVFRRARA